MNPVIQTASGRYVDLSDPKPDSIAIEDVAAALSKLCRFTGHVRYVLSVGEHSVLVSRLIDQKYAREGLMHDASEAYLGDVSSPLKSLLPGYRLLEDRMTAVIARKFNLDTSAEAHAAVKQADLEALKLERRALMPKDDSEHWRLLDNVADRPGFAITGLAPELARREFLARYQELTR